MFLTLGALLYVPIIALQWTLGDRTSPTAVNATGVSISTGIGATSSSLAGLCFIVVWGVGCYSVIIAVVSDLYTTGDADIVRAFQRIVPRLPSAIGASILAVLAIVVGFILLIIPGVILGLGFFAIPAVAVLEPLGATQALSRSAALSRGLKGHIGTSLFLVGLIVGVMELFAALLGTGLAFLIHGGYSVSSVSFFVTVAQALAKICFGAVAPTMATLLYYDARIRNEGYDIELMARTVDTATAQAPAY